MHEICFEINGQKICVPIPILLVRWKPEPDPDPWREILDLSLIHI